MPQLDLIANKRPFSAENAQLLEARLSRLGMSLSGERRGLLPKVNLIIFCREIELRDLNFCGPIYSPCAQAAGEENSITDI